MGQAINTAVIDELLSLSDDGDTSLLVDLIEMFLADAPAKVTAIRQGLAKRDLHQVELAAHSLKGSAGNLGATLVQQVCDQLQRMARSQDKVNEVETLVRQLSHPFEQALGELKALLALHKK